MVEVDVVVSVVPSVVSWDDVSVVALVFLHLVVPSSLSPNSFVSVLDIGDVFLDDDVLLEGFVVVDIFWGIGLGGVVLFGVLGLEVGVLWVVN